MLLLVKYRGSMLSVGVVVLVRFIMTPCSYPQICIQDLISPINVSLNFSLLEEEGIPRNQKMVRLMEGWIFKGKTGNFSEQR